MGSMADTEIDEFEEQFKKHGRYKLALVFLILVLIICHQLFYHHIAVLKYDIIS